MKLSELFKSTRLSKKTNDAKMFRKKIDFRKWIHTAKIARTKKNHDNWANPNLSGCLLYTDMFTGKKQSKY